MTIEEHCRRWLEALGSVPKMCIMLSAHAQPLPKAEATQERTL
jgi:hypothetical protein